MRTAIDVFNQHGSGSEELSLELDKVYRQARTTLRERQRRKCAYCEKIEDAFKRPVEHFRPKGGAENKVNRGWVRVDTHYWWLAWSWSNLYFSCDECNRTGHKGNRFPIEPGSSRMPAPTQGAASYPLAATFFDVSQEKPMLLDPRQDQPELHLQWIPRDGTKPKVTWEWRLEERGNRGQTTIQVLGLKEREEEVNLHLAGLRDGWKDIENYLKHTLPDEAKDKWDRLVRVFVDDPAQPYRLAAWWALRSLCPPAEQVQYGFRPPAVPQLSWP